MHRVYQDYFLLLPVAHVIVAPHCDSHFFPSFLFFLFLSRLRADTSPGVHCRPLHTAHTLPSTRISFHIKQPSSQYWHFTLILRFDICTPSLSIFSMVVFFPDMPLFIPRLRHVTIFQTEQMVCSAFSRLSRLLSFSNDNAILQRSNNVTPRGFRYVRVREDATCHAPFSMSAAEGAFLAAARHASEIVAKDRVQPEPTPLHASRRYLLL